LTTIFPNVKFLVGTPKRFTSAVKIAHGVMNTKMNYEDEEAFFVGFEAVCRQNI